MLNKKIIKFSLVSTVLLSMGTATLLSVTNESQAKTILSQDKVKSVISFTAKDLKKATSVKLSKNNVQKMYKKLKKEDTWKKLGYTKKEAKKISQRCSISLFQTQGILKSMVSDSNLEFKVIYIHKGPFENVSLGTENTKPSKPEKPETSKPSILDDSIKEIDVQIDYNERNTDIDLDVDVRNDGEIRSKFENRGTKTKLQGNKATKLAADVFNGVDFENMSEEEITSYILNELDGENNFKQFKFKLRYFDGKQIQFTNKNQEKPESGQSILDDSIKQIDVQIDYNERNTDIDLDVEIRNDGEVRSKFENRGTKTKLQGDKATKLAADIFNDVDFDSMSQTEITNYILEQLDANKEFKQFKFKVKYFDRTQVEFSQKGQSSSNKPSIPGILDDSIKEIDVQIDYNKRNTDIDLDVDIRNDGEVRSKFENRGTKTKLQGDKATKLAADIFNDVDFQSMTKKEITDYILDELNASDNFKQFKFKVKYFDRSQVQFQVR